MDVGVEIGHYKVIEHIGRGGMADVWSARDTRLNRMVAIKTIAHGLSQDVDPISLFQQEAQTIAQMEHPHILPIYDFGEFEGQLYIVMRYVAGGSLEDLLRRGPMPLNEALRMGQAIASALDYAHSSKVVHLDLKPPNVLLDSHNSPYLADFGLATVLDREGKAMNPGSGTLLYMAPEQLTAELIDHRADIYSFAIVLFHMLTGQLPFDAAMPLALKQLQFQQDLPDIDAINPTVPPYLTEILRRATAVDPKQRPRNVLAIIEEMRETLTTANVMVMGAFSDANTELDPSAISTQELPGVTDAELLEAVDIYSRARHAWAGGNGRFLLGVTHFMLMNGYYMQADKYGLEADDAGMQMLLRGALEYDHEVNFWWDKQNDESRRWVCLHATRSGNAPARVRAFYRLETLTDAEKPQIPKLVAQALQIETNEEARLAALQVLGTRAKLMTRRQQYDIKTEYRGRMLTTMTRLGIQIAPPGEWQEVVYTPEIDLLVAEIALDTGMPRVSEFAARIIGRIHSTLAVRHIAHQQSEGRAGALRALALVRDESPSLPPVVNAEGRIYAWLTNSIRRMFDKPLTLVWRFLFALLGGGFAMALYVWITYRGEAIFTLQRYGNTMAVGVMFGIFTAFMVMIAGEFPSRLRGFWPFWVRALASVGLGALLGTLTWTQFTSFYLQLPTEDDVMRFGGIGLALGFVITALFNLPSYVAIPLTVFGAYLPVWATWQHYWFYERESIYVAVFAAILAVGAAIVFSMINKAVSNTQRRLAYLGGTAALFLILIVTMWRSIPGAELSEKITVNEIAATLFALVIIGLAVRYAAFLTKDDEPQRNLIITVVTGVGSLAVLVALGWYYTNQKSGSPPLTEVPLVYFDFPKQIYTIMIPFAMLIGFGGHMPALARDIASLVRQLRGEAARRTPQPVSLPVIPQIDLEALNVAGELDETGAEPQHMVSVGTELEPQIDGLRLVDAANPAFRTEVDPAQGRILESGEMAVQGTEVDVNQGQASGQTYATELDVAQGRRAQKASQSPPESTPGSSTKSRRINFGGGSKPGVSSGPKTEVDVNLGRSKPDPEKEE